MLGRSNSFQSFLRHASMQLAVILVLVGTFLVNEMSPQEPVDAAMLRLILVLGSCLGTVLFAHLGTAFIVQKIGNNTADLRRRMAALKQAHQLLWIFFTAGIIHGLAWPQIVRFNWRLDGIFLLDEVLILAPAFSPLVISWAMFFDGDRLTGRVRDRRQYVMLHFRHYLGFAYIPTFAALILHDALNLFKLPEHLFYIISLGVLLLGYPWILRFIWQTEPLPAGALRDRLLRVSDRIGLPLSELLIWKTDGQVVNAVASGFAPQTRFVFLSDGLLDCLTHDEVEAVFLHEAAHIRRGHCWWRILVLLLPIGIWLFVQQFDSIEQISPTLLAIGYAVYAVFSLGLCSHALELDADSCAMLWLESVADSDSVVLISALEKLARGTKRNRPTWLHPSIAMRIDRLRYNRSHRLRGNND